MGPTLVIRGSRQSACPAKLAAFNCISHVAAPAIEYLFATFCRVFFSHSSPVQPSTTVRPRSVRQLISVVDVEDADELVVVVDVLLPAVVVVVVGGISARHCASQVVVPGGSHASAFAGSTMKSPQIDSTALTGRGGCPLALSLPRKDWHVASILARRRTFFCVPQVRQFALTLIPFAVAVSCPVVTAQTLPIEIRGPSMTTASRGTAVSPAMSASPTTR
jgi:hypothetical protein